VTQQLRLQLVVAQAIAARADRAAGVDDAVPGNRVFRGQRVQRVPHQPGLAR
jgi:hypothetical protein